MALSYEADEARTFAMDFHDPHRRLESPEREIEVVDAGLEALVVAGVLPHARYDHALLLACREAVAARFDIPWTAITHRMQRLIWAINAIHQPRTLVAVGIFCGNTFVANAGAAIGPGACYAAERLVGLEIRPEEADRARRNVATVDPEGQAEVLAEDGIAWLQAFDGVVDLLYLDADGRQGQGKSIYLELVEAADHALRPGSLVLAHNSVNAATQLADYLACVRDPERFGRSVHMVVDDQGLEVSRR